MKQLSKAIVFAAQAHAGQHRKDGKTPYINHPLEVMNLVVRHVDNVSEEILIAAVLHDVVEDTTITSAEIKIMFGARVSKLVAELTDDKLMTKEERKRMQLEDVHRLSPEGKLLRLCDKICNVYDILYAPPGDWEIRRRMDYVRWAKAVVDKIRGTHPVLEKRFDELFVAGVKLLNE
ncbi:MAG TPA: HD domain-containing protein [Bacteroidia bacterium]|nr:HD domain-containing protein [Bacteroidia bacterium]